MPLRKAAWLAGMLLAAVGVSAFGQSSDVQAALQAKLNSTFALTKTTADRSDIVTAGAVLVLQKDGLMLYATNSPVPPVNTYKNGKISQNMGGLGSDFKIRMMSRGKSTANDFPKQQYVTGQKVWVTGITVSNNTASFVLYTDPDANNVRYYGQLNIPIANGASADDAMKTVGEALTVQADTSTAAAQPGAPAPIAPPAAPADASQPAMAPIAPPPPPTDAPAAAPKTISMGQTKDQVTAILGSPKKVVNLGAKEIDYYPDMKVVYTNGKVSDVQ